MSQLPVEPAWRLAERAEEHRWLVTGLWAEQAVGIAMIGVGMAFATPPSKPCRRFSRTRLSSRWFLHRDRLADCQAVCRANSPAFAKKAFGHVLWINVPNPMCDRFLCFNSIERSRLRMNPSRSAKVVR